MVTAQRHRLATPHTPSYTAVYPLRRPAPDPAPRERPVPKSRRREYQAWMSVLIVASGLFLALGILSLYGRICQTKEINRRSQLKAEMRLAEQKSEEIALRRASEENDQATEQLAIKFNMVRRTDSDAVTIP